MPANLIKCPNCNHEFYVEDVLSQQLELKLKEKYELERKQLLENMMQKEKL